jgi:hypothetical protein
MTRSRPDGDTPLPPPTGPNQLVNGCFEGSHGAPPPAPWVCTSGWDVSKKPSNPCVGADGNYAARINDPTQSGFSGPNRDERIWQVVAGHGARLVAEMMGVHHYALYAEMRVYTSDTPSGPWVLIWTPFTLADVAVDRWGTEVKHAEIDLGQAYAYYKVEFAAMYAAVGPSGDEGGVKFTRAYFESY